MLYVNLQDVSDTVQVLVTRVKTMKLSQVAARMGKSAEWPGRVLLQGMREHYPAIAMDSDVVVFHHLPPDVLS